MAAASTVAVALPAVIPATKHLADKATEVYQMNKAVDLMNLALKTGSIDELAESMIQYGDELQEAGELLAKQIAEGGLDIVKLSGNNIQHIKKHTFEGMAEQAKYLSDEQLANKLANTTFFNKNWSQDEVVKYTQEAYNTLRNQGKTGLHSVEINGEIIKVFIKEDGSFDTAYGVYQYTVDDFR